MLNVSSMCVTQFNMLFRFQRMLYNNVSHIYIQIHSSE